MFAKKLKNEREALIVDLNMLEQKLQGNSLSPERKAQIKEAIRKLREELDTKIQKKNGEKK